VKTEREAGGRVVSLEARAGLPLGVGEGGRLVFAGGLPEVTPQPRTLGEMRSVLYNQTAGGPAVFYLMYRGLGWPADAESLAQDHLRLDVTVLVPGLVGGEYVKTAGHYHPLLPHPLVPHPLVPHATAAPRTYPELYQVLSGRAHYLLQMPSPAGPPGAIADVVVVEAGPGDALYVPPGYGHVTINPGPEPLVMLNIAEATFASEYGPYLASHGAAYYEIEEQGRAYFVANGHYHDPPKPRLASPTTLSALGLRDGVALYTQLARKPRDFAFLAHPLADGPVL